MHKPVPEEEVTSLHDLSAVDLIAGYRAKQFSPSEVMEEVLDHVAAWEPHIKALYLFDPDGARATARASTDRCRRASLLARLTAYRSRSRTISPPRASRFRWEQPASSWFPRRRMRRRPHGCAKPAR